MNVEYVFSEPVSLIQRQIDTNSTMEEIFALLGKHESPRLTGKANGKRIDLFPELFDNEDIPNLYDIVSSIVQAVEQYRQAINMKQLEVTSLWINLNGYGGYNERHSHPGSIVSGAFYIKVPEDSDSPFKLIKSRESVDYGYSNAFESDGPPAQMYNALVIPPEEGKLIIFPSYLDHEVPPNNSNDYRVSISFNTRIVDESI